MLKRRSLTVSDLEQGLGDDAAGDVEGLAAVVSHVRALGVGDGQVAALGHGKPAGGLRRLVGEEQILPGTKSLFNVSLPHITVVKIKRRMGGGGCLPDCLPVARKWPAEGCRWLRTGR